MIYEAGPVTILRTILIIALVYYGIKFFIKVVAPYFLKRFIAKQASKFQQQSSNSTTSRGNEKASSANKTTSNKNGSLGEYVDYEEVD